MRPWRPCSRSLLSEPEGQLRWIGREGSQRIVLCRHEDRALEPTTRERHANRFERHLRPVALVTQVGEHHRLESSVTESREKARRRVVGEVSRDASDAATD